MLHVYGVEIEKVEGKHIDEMTEEEKIHLVEECGDNGEEYTLQGWFDYLNADMIDTENYYWLVLNY